MYMHKILFTPPRKQIGFKAVYPWLYVIRYGDMWHQPAGPTCKYKLLFYSFQFMPETTTTFYRELTMGL